MGDRLNQFSTFKSGTEEKAYENGRAIVKDDHLIVNEQRNNATSQPH
jgi:hypothetical protein